MKKIISSIVLLAISISSVFAQYLDSAINNSQITLVGNKAYTLEVIEEQYSIVEFSFPGLQETNRLEFDEIPMSIMANEFGIVLTKDFNSECADNKFVETFTIVSYNAKLEKVTEKEFTNEYTDFIYSFLCEETKSKKKKKKKKNSLNNLTRVPLFVK
jgi:hypothetical protein